VEGRLHHSFIMLSMSTPPPYTLDDEPFPSVPSPEAPYVTTLPAHPCHREFPYAPPQKRRRLQELISEQRAQNKLASAFDQHVGFQNVRSARSGPEGDGGVYTIIDSAIESNLDQYNFVSTGLTAADFDPYQQGHCIHTRLYRGFRIAAAVANSKHQGGVAVAWCVEPKKGVPHSKLNQDIESFRRHGPNCLSYHALFGETRQPVIVAYLLPDTLEDLHHLQAAFDRFKNRCPPMLMGDLNVDLYSPAPDLRTRQVADFLAANGMEDMLQHFHSRRRFRHQKTWYQKRYNADGTIQTILRSRTDYIMTSPTLRHYFSNVQLVDPRIVNTDHYMIKATIKSAHRKAQRKYLQGRRKFPLPPIKPTLPTFTQADQLFMELKSYSMPRPKQKQPYLWSDWVSDHTKQLIRKRCDLANTNRRIRCYMPMVN